MSTGGPRAGSRYFADVGPRPGSRLLPLAVGFALDDQFVGRALDEPARAELSRASRGWKAVYAALREEERGGTSLARSLPGSDRTHALRASWPRPARAAVLPIWNDLAKQPCGGGDVRETALEAARFLVAHASEHLSLADLADHVSYSPYHLARAFERELGVSPGQLLAAHRFQRAKELLLLSDDAVLDICLAVGFSSLGTFTRRFGAAVGTSPTGFRRLPDYLIAAPPEPLVVPGPDPSGGRVLASVNLEHAAMELLGRDPATYVGLFAPLLPKGSRCPARCLASPVRSA